MPVITISSGGVISWEAVQAKCALGANGMCAAQNKREGDGKTPKGEYHLRRVLYRADRIDAPQTVLPVRAVHQNDGWCDDPGDPAYNRPIALPYAARHEPLWRIDHVYDLIGVISHNDNPPVRELGSAVFIHLARPDYSPTRGCVALAEPDLRALLTFASTSTQIRIG